MAKDSSGHAVSLYDFITIPAAEGRSAGVGRIVELRETTKGTQVRAAFVDASGSGRVQKVWLDPEKERLLMTGAGELVAPAAAPVAEVGFGKGAKGGAQPK